MQKTLLLVVVASILAGAAYFIWSRAPRIADVTPTPVTSPMHMTVEEIHEDTESYVLRARYPQFGIASVDAAVAAQVDAAITAFKGYPMNPPELDMRKYEMDIDFLNVYTGSDYVSVEMLIVEDTGGAHPNSIRFGINTDLASGKELSLDEALLLIGKTLEQVSGESIAQIEEEIGEKLPFPEGAEPKPENFSTFTVSEKEVTFIFNNYQVAPYSAGYQMASFARVR